MYQGMGYYRGYGDAASDEAASVAQYAYSLLQSNLQSEGVASLNTSSTPAVKQAACQIMTTQAASDADKTMAGKVSAACASAGASSAGGLSKTTWIILGGVSVIGLYLLLKKK